MVSLRLDKKIEKKLKQIAQAKGISQSEYLRTIITSSLNREVLDEMPWSLGEDVFGRYGSSKGNLASNRKSILKEKIRAKKSRN